MVSLFPKVISRPVHKLDGRFTREVATVVTGLQTEPYHNLAVSLTASMLNILCTRPTPGLEVIKLEFIHRLKIKRNDWLHADTCPHATNHCALF